MGKRKDTREQQEVPEYEAVRGSRPLVRDEREVVRKNAGLAPRQPHHHVFELRWCQRVLQTLCCFRKVWVDTTDFSRFASISFRLIGILFASTERTVRDLTENYKHREG